MYNVYVSRSSNHFLDHTGEARTRHFWKGRDSHLHDNIYHVNETQFSECLLCISCHINYLCFSVTFDSSWTVGKLGLTCPSREPTKVGSCWCSCITMFEVSVEVCMIVHYAFDWTTFVISGNGKVIWWVVQIWVFLISRCMPYI
jgi:hypothetical protein